MAIVIASSFVGESATSSVAIPVSGVIPGDLLVALTFAFFGGVSPQIAAPVDNQSNIWTQRSLTTSSDSAQAALHDCLVSKLVAPTSVTVSCGTASSNISGVILRVTGHDIARYAGSFAGANTAVTQTPPGPSISPSPLGSYLYIEGITHAGASGVTLNGPSTFISVVKLLSPSTGVPYAVSMKVAARATEVPLWVTSSSQNYWTAAAAYLQGGGSSDTSPIEAGWVG